MKRDTNIHYVLDHCSKRFQGQKLKVKVMIKQLTYNGGGIHFDGVASRLTCFRSARVETRNSYHFSEHLHTFSNNNSTDTCNSDSFLTLLHMLLGAKANALRGLECRYLLFRTFFDGGEIAFSDYSSDLVLDS